MPPKQIGVTGGIGAGKSLVCRIFKILGTPVYNADERARWLMTNQPDLIKAIKDKFGPEAFFNDGSLNRSYLSQRMFVDEGQVDWLNHLVHPRVAEDYSKWVGQHQNYKYTIKEAALLFESGSYKDLDSIIVVMAPTKLRMERVIKRDPQRTEEQIKGIIDHQMNDAQREAKADYLIQNDGKQLLLTQVLELHRRFEGS